MTLIGAEALRTLRKNEWRVLLAIEIGMRHSEYVELETIAKYAGFTVPDTQNWLKRCHKLNLIHRWTGHFVGYELTIHGYDALALNTLYERKHITSIGREKGVGKESRVFFGLDMKDNEVILKMHRVGYTSFHQVRKKRRYTANKKHMSELYASRLSAETELKWMELANSLELPVPKIYASNRHILVMELVDGIDLVKLKKLPDAEDTMDKLLSFIASAWKVGKFVHGDLSEHNVIMTHDAEPIVIDFPQAVASTMRGADEMLERDVTNILAYFERKHGIRTSVDEVLTYIKDDNQ
ncbi:MAG: RIO1 family regulatory kinase/ATPase domain-containing protein [Candidatus Kariarchaeaceae archaeon]|jgi:RIO kinase 2